jgi:hypothetical protein
METSGTTATAPATAAAPATATAATPSTGSTGTQGAAPAVQTSPISSPEALDSENAIKAMVAAAEQKGFGAEKKEPKLTQDEPAVAEVKADEPEAAEAAPAKETQGEPEQQDGYSLEEDGFVGARDLAAKFDANPALKAALTPEIRNELMANARLAQQGAEYRKLFASPSEAKIIHETAQTHAGFSEAFNLIHSDVEKGTTAFLQKLIEGSALRDEAGNPIKDDQGYFRTDGSANKFVETLGKRWLNKFVVEKAAGLNDENVMAALDLVMESVGLRPSSADKTQDQDPALVARKQALDAREAELNKQRESDRSSAAKTYKDALNLERTAMYDAEVGKLLQLATGLSEFERSGVEQRLEEGIRSAIKTNAAYQTRMGQLAQRQFGPARRAEELKTLREFFRDNLANIARPIFAKAGISATTRSAQRTAEAAARAEGARSEIGGAAPAAKGQGAQQNVSPAQAFEQARAQFRDANGGKEPTESELNIFMMLNHAKSKGYAA